MANPSPVGLYLLNNSNKGSQAIGTHYSSIPDVRTTFHIVAIRLNSSKSNLRVDETNMGTSVADIGSVSPTTLLQLGSRGDGAYACLGYMSELIIYDRYHTDKEVLIIEKYLKDKYNL